MILKYEKVYINCLFNCFNLHHLSRVFAEINITYFILAYDSCFRTNRLLETVCEDVGANHFYGCMWDCLASNSAVRSTAIAYILAHFDKKLSMEDQPHIMGTNIETMVSI